MAYKDFGSFDSASGENTQSNAITLEINGNTVDLPDASYVRDAEISRDGMDLVLDGPNGEITIEGYYAQADAPTLIAPDGAVLTPELVESFASSGNQYAANLSMNDASPIGAVQEISGEATITRADGTSEPMTLGTHVYQGDVVETNTGGAVNLVFSDESSFAVSEDTRLAIDEYVFDPATQGGTQNFSVLKGVFVYTSGFIGREDPDDVSIDTPSGSIGIRGTIIAGDVNDGEITVVEGAIVLRDPSGAEMTLANQFETGKFQPGGQGIQNMGQMKADAMMQKFSVISKVAPTLFSSINDAAAEQNNAPEAPANNTDADQQQQTPDRPNDQQQDFDADGATDQNGDNKVDGTLEQKAEGEQSEPSDTAQEAQGEQTAADGETTTGEGEGEGEGEVQQAKPAVIKTATADATQEATKAAVTNTTRTTQNAQTETKIAEIREQRAERQEQRKEAQQEKKETLQQENDDKSDTNDLVTQDTPDTPAVTALDSNITWYQVDELPHNATLAADLAVFKITATGGAGALTFDLLGMDASTFSINQIDAKNWEISVKAGQNLNYEKIRAEILNNEIDLSYKITDANGEIVTETLFDNVADLHVTDINEAPILFDHLIQGTPDSYFRATKGNTWNFNAKQLFTDVDNGDSLTFQLDDATLDILTGAELVNGIDVSTLLNTSLYPDGWYLNTETGEFTIQFNTGASDWSDFTLADMHFGIKAIDSDGLETVFTHDLELVSNNQEQPNLSAIMGWDGYEAFTGDGDNEITIDYSSNTYFNTGNGDDIVRINGGDHHEIITGYGDDIVKVRDGVEDSNIHTMDGNDRIEMNASQFNSMMPGASGAGMFIDAGSNTGSFYNGNGDTLFIENAGDVDFSALRGNGNQFKNFEYIDAANGQANTITLSYNDVISMTDGRNTLLIKAGSNDTINFDAMALGDATPDGTASIDTDGGGTPETYNVYHFDDVTLLVTSYAGDVNISNAATV
ncbi:MAG: FecR domain-containing protein [Bdellovibrionales bacterium]